MFYDNLICFVSRRQPAGVAATGPCRSAPWHR
jgi:hypothetical protein